MSFGGAELGASSYRFGEGGFANWRRLVREAAESRARELEAAIHRFRDCGVEIERFSIIERPGINESVLCVDGIPRFTWRLVCNPIHFLNNERTRG